MFRTKTWTLVVVHVFEYWFSFFTLNLDWSLIVVFMKKILILLVFVFESYCFSFFTLSQDWS